MDIGRFISGAKVSSSGSMTQRTPDFYKISSHVALLESLRINATESTFLYTSFQPAIEIPS